MGQNIRARYINTNRVSDFSTAPAVTFFYRSLIDRNLPIGGEDFFMGKVA
ncbi:MAG: hypothetical protein ACOX5F_03135 [Anaerovoracaceae bacterium]|jgi:hypothetical protein